jgi:hypothetical protein
MRTVLVHFRFKWNVARTMTKKDLIHFLFFIEIILFAIMIGFLL